MFRLFRKIKNKIFFGIMGLISAGTTISNALTGCSGQIKSLIPEKITEAFNSTSDFEVHFIDVGQGDAALIKCDDKYMLIDAGENDKGTLVQNYLEKQGVDKLDILVGTHPDSDHIGGLDVIITKFECKTILMPDCEKDTATYRDVIDAITYKNYSITYPEVGEVYSLGEAIITVLAPSYYYEDTNNNSIVLKVSYGESDFLFMGDAEIESEQAILNSDFNLDCEVIKMGHHGSSTSNSEELIRAVSPDYSIISCGENNSYGHPHYETLELIDTYNITNYRTDKDGTIIAISDGKDIRFK